MEWLIAILTIVIGSLLLIVPSYYILHHFGKIAKEQETTISIHALKHASRLAIAGIIILIIGILYLMKIIPL